MLYSRVVNGTALETPRVAEALLWLAQGKTNGEIATIPQ